MHDVVVVWLGRAGTAFISATSSLVSLQVRNRFSRHSFRGIFCTTHVVKQIHTQSLESTVTIIA